MVLKGEINHQYFERDLININTNINILKVTLSISIPISIVLITSISIFFQYQYWYSQHKVIVLFAAAMVSGMLENTPHGSQKQKSVLKSACLASLNDNKASTL